MMKAAVSQSGRAPLIDECIANFECKVVGELVTGDHTVFAGRIVAAHVNETPQKRLYTLAGGRFKGL